MCVLWMFYLDWELEGQKNKARDVWVKTFKGRVQRKQTSVLSKALYDYISLLTANVTPSRLLMDSWTCKEKRKKNADFKIADLHIYIY